MMLHLRTLAAVLFLLGAGTLAPVRAWADGSVERQIEGLRREAADYEAAGLERRAWAAYQQAIKLGDTSQSTYDGLRRTTQAIKAARSAAGAQSQSSLETSNAGNASRVGSNAYPHSATAPSQSEGSQRPGDNSGAGSGPVATWKAAGSAAAHTTPGESMARWERNLSLSFFLLIGLAGFILTYLGRWLRGRGDLLAVIDYPPECRGEFSVRLARRIELPRPAEGGRSSGEDGGAKARRSSRFEQHM